MGQPSQELIADSVSEESSASSSTHSTNSSSSLDQQDGLAGFSESPPSPFQGEGRGEGEGTTAQLGVVVGQLRNIHDQGQPLVDFPGNPSLAPIQARSTVEVDNAHLGCDVVLMFDQGDRRKPIIMGVISSSGNIPLDSDKDEEAGHTEQTNVDIDGERVTFSAKREIVLRCGKASITLTRAGKILIRGAYLLSRSSGVNRVKGGSVQIN